MILERRQTKPESPMNASSYYFEKVFHVVEQKNETEAKARRPFELRKQK